MLYRKKVALFAALICFLMAAFLFPYAVGAQELASCDYAGEIVEARAVYWLDQWTAYQVDVDAVLALDTSDTLQAFYGDPHTTDDNHWVGAPDDLAHYLTFTFTTADDHDYWLGFGASDTGTTDLFGVMLMSRVRSGIGDYDGLHDICKAFRIDRDSVENLLGAEMRWGIGEWVLVEP